jgi:3-deoxy-D-manno-octulosonate 8-phosphate phosphatase (KDO 8-P phosphatase)
MARIKAVALDVDGVLTDGGFWWGPNGEEFKRFSFADVMGISLARKAGLVVALISGEESSLVGRYAAKMGLDAVYTGCKDKGGALRSFAQTNGLNLSEVCFMGDDVNDLPAIELAGLSAAPANAHHSVRQKVKLIMQHSGGNGAVRELVDRILSSQKSGVGSKARKKRKT